MFAIRLDWLKQQSCGKAAKDNDVDIFDKVARGYLLYTIGCCLVLDKSGKKMLAYYLNTFKGSMDDVKEKAWGVAILAYLHKQLGLASRADVKQLSGCLSLLMVWTSPSSLISNSG